MGEIIAAYGIATYAILFAVIFIETGLVFFPFLPGDSLLFVTGAFAALGALNPLVLIALLALAAVFGDTVNYWIGRFIGPRAFHSNSRLLNKKHLERTRVFYEKHGGSTVIMARFVPIVRTFAPFVAGVGEMRYRLFLPYSILGNCLWIGIFTFGGYFFGNLPIVKENFSLVIVLVIFISIVPGVIEYLKHRKEGL